MRKIPDPPRRVPQLAELNRNRKKIAPPGGYRFLGHSPWTVWNGWNDWNWMEWEGAAA
jgi:hypothetical protein